MAVGSDEELSDFEELEHLQNKNEIGCECMDIGNGNKNNIKLCSTFTYSCLHIDIGANPSIFITAAELKISITLPSSHHLLSTTSPTTTWTTQLKKPNIHEVCLKSPTDPSLPIPDSPLENFHLFHTAELLDFITDQTNNYAKQEIPPENFDPITRADIEAFLGFNILMRINSLPTLHMYWEKDSWHHCVLIADRISRHRYKEISRYLHFSDNNTLSPPGSSHYANETGEKGDKSLGDSRSEWIFFPIAGIHWEKEKCGAYSWRTCSGRAHQQFHWMLALCFL